MLLFLEEGPEGEAAEKGSKNVSLNLVLLQRLSFSFDIIETRVGKDPLSS